VREAKIIKRVSGMYASERLRNFEEQACDEIIEQRARGET
jgi:hypothetical protein